MTCGVEGDAALEPKSRAPHRVANRTPVEVEDVIVAKRKQLEGAGLDAGPESIAFHLQDLEGCPTASTIWRRLKERGFITPEPSKAPKHTGRRFNAERANECWQLDDTPWALTDGTEVKILNVIDDHSRLLVASVAMVTCTGAAALAAVADAAAVLGWPAWVQSDNAKAFRHILVPALGALGIASKRSPALPPPDQRQSRTVPPDPQEVARQTTTRRDHHRAPSPTRHVPVHLQPPASPPLHRPALPSPLLGHRPQDRSR